MIKASAIASAIMLGVFLSAPGGAARGQIRAVGPGATVEGDRLRGEGVYLQGLGWYELNAAKARNRDAETEKKLYDWNKQLYNDYMRERDAELARKSNLAKAQAEEARRRYEEREARLRTSPNDDDIRRGDALNAMLADLSDPSISESSWRLAQVPLPDDLSIKRLVFRFAAKSGARGSEELSRAVISLGQLDAEGHWPGYFPANSLVEERRAYEAAYRTIRDQCLAGRLDSGAVLELDRTVRTLKAKVGTAIPAERGYRASAVRFVADLEKSAKIFDALTYDYAREIISDTHKHEAKTVGELLAFMRKYRLLFANGEKSPETVALYGRLYDLLRKQADGLGLKPGERLKAGAVAAVIRPFNGKNFEGWNGWHAKDPINPATICRIDGEDLVWTARKAGRIVVDKLYSDVIFAFEYRIDGRSHDANGVLELAVNDTFRLGQSKDRVFQVNLALLDSATAKAGDIVPLKYQSRRPTDGVSARSSDAQRPSGQWNEVEVCCEGRVIRLLINGREVNSMEANRPVVCHPGLQADGTDVRFRNIRLVPLKAGVPRDAARLSR